MSVQHINEVQQIARAAKAIGATLPDQITTALDHLQTITTSAEQRPNAGIIAADLAQHLGNPAALDKARKAAAQSLANAEANAKIDVHLATACASRLRTLIRRDSEQVATAIGEALAADLATLQTDAYKLPALFRAEHADRLAAGGFGAWCRARDAYDRIKTTQTALATLYGAATREHEGQFPNTAAASLRFAKPPRFTTSHDAYGFRDALAGRAERRQGVASQGSTFADGLFVPAALAQAGATFEWATPSEVTARAQAIVTAMTSEHVAA